jgi:hypothetical protein
MKMKNLFTVLLGSMVSASAFGQAALPTGWNFDDLQPDGWTEELSANPGNTRYTNGSVGAACRLDGDDEYVMVHFSDVCGGVSYEIKAQGTASNDIFSIQESVDGTVWTDLRLLMSADIAATANAYVEFTDVPQATSRYIRWYFTEKQSGRNIALDEIELIAQVPTSEEEIGVSSGGDPVVNNSTFVIGNVASTTFTIENVNLAGGDTLTISNMVISGPNASEFTVSGVSTPFDVLAAGTVNFNVDFSTAMTGSRFATLTITNDDANGDETNFVINLYGIGGSFATEPTAQPELQIDQAMTYFYEVQLQAPVVAAEKYIVTRGVNTTTLATPLDGETYVKGDYIDANTQVIHVGPAGTFKPKYIVAGTSFYHEAYSVNGPEGYENYLTTNPPTFPVVTPADHIGNYYDGIDPSSTSFLTDLQTRISQNYDQVFYSNYAPIMIEKFASRDTIGGQTVITGAYSGYKHIYTGPFFYDVLSREHSWPHSWMPTFPDEEGLEYSDLHNLFPVHQDNANAVRSNRPLGEVVSVESTFGDAQYGDNAASQRVYEPRDEHKGDAARAIFYMAVKWNGTGGTWELPNPIDFIVQYGQDQDVLKQWHWQDPPDAWEIARNDFIESEQGNRNPFVDSVNWVCYIDFETLTYIGEQSTPCTVTPDGIEEQLTGDFSISPNPTDGVAALTLNLKDAQELTINVLDVTGRMVSTRTKNFSVGMSREMLDLSNLDAGIYHVVLQGENGRTALKVVLQ